MTQNFNLKLRLRFKTNKIILKHSILKLAHWYGQKRYNVQK